MQQINLNNSSNAVASSSSAGVATRSIAGGVDVTLDVEAAAADIIKITGLGAVINVNIPRQTGLKPLDTASAASGVVVGYARRIMLRLENTGAFVITVRGVDLVTGAFGVGVACPLPGAATPNFEIYTLDGLTYYAVSVAVAN